MGLDTCSEDEGTRYSAEIAVKMNCLLYMKAMSGNAKTTTPEL